MGSRFGYDFRSSCNCSCVSITEQDLQFQRHPSRENKVYSVRKTLVPDVSGTSLWSDYMSREAYMYERSVGVKWQSHGNSLHYYTVLDIAAFGKVQGAVPWHWSLLSTPTNECLIHCCLGYSFILFIFYLLFLYLVLFAWVGKILNTCKGPYT